VSGYGVANELATFHLVQRKLSIAFHSTSDKTLSYIIMSPICPSRDKLNVVEAVAGIEEITEELTIRGVGFAELTI
jgi:hypothetical protein